MTAPHRLAALWIVAIAGGAIWMDSIHTGWVPGYLIAIAALSLQWWLYAGIPREEAHWLRWWIPGSLSMLLALLAPPALSDDVFRYLWEGHVQNQGYSPFGQAPESLFPSLAHPAEPYLNHPHLPAIYPPLAQALFRLADGLGHHVFTWKLILMTSLMLTRWFLPVRTFMLLMFHPLVLVEGIWNAHLDLAGLVLVWALFRTAGRSKSNGVPGLLGAALFSLKIVPAVFLPMAVANRSFGRQCHSAAVCGLAVVASYLPFLMDGAGLFQSLSTFSSQWYFNNPNFYALAHLGSPESARVVLTLTLGAGLIWLYLHRGVGIRDRCRSAWLLVLLCSPTVYPWYLLWLLPLTRPRHWYLVAIAYAAASLSYWILIDYHRSGSWQIHPAWLIGEWLVLYGCFWRLWPASLRSLDDLVRFRPIPR